MPLPRTSLTSGSGNGNGGNDVVRRSVAREQERMIVAASAIAGVGSGTGAGRYRRECSWCGREALRADPILAGYASCGSRGAHR